MYVNAGYLILRGIILFIIVINYCVQKWIDLARMEKALYIFSVTMVFFALAYPVSRMLGAIIQIHNQIPNSLKGTCVTYKNRKLFADPFRDWSGSNGWIFNAKGTCWNEIDLIVVLSSIIILGILTFLFISCCCTIVFVCTYQSQKAKKAAELRERENQEAEARAEARAEEQAKVRKVERLRAHIDRKGSHLNIDESILAMYRVQSSMIES